MNIPKIFKAAGIMFFLVALTCIYTEYANAGADEGKKIFAGKKCGNCHKTEGPAAEKTFEDKLKKKGPDLWFAGSKFKKEWLGEWMQNPTAIRPLEYNSIEKTNPGNHPKLAKKESEDVTEYLKNHTKQDFEKLLTEAKTIPKPPPVFHYRSVVRKDGTDIERAKQYPIENLIKFQNKKAKCIWHNEKSPSLHLYPDNNVFCFGCGKGGDAIDVKMQLDSISFTEAVNILKL